MALTDRFYIVGGTVPLQAASYLARAADHELAQALLAGEYCLLLHARQMGKSSLSVRAMGRLQEQGVRAVLVDLAKLGGANLTPEQWYLGVLLEIGRGLDLRREFLTYWQAHSSLSCVQRLFGALREVALPRLAEPIVVFIDELDVTRSLRFGADEFFGAMRHCYDARVRDPESRRLTFCLVGSALPTDLVRDRRLSPFNVGRRIDLKDFTEEEVLPLAEGLDRPGAEVLLRRACSWTQGHPYLTQSLCAAIAADASVRTVRDVDRVVGGLFFAPEARERNVNLADVANRMLGAVEEGQTPEEHRAGVLDLYRQVRRGRPVVDDEADRRVAVLKLSGITRTVQGCLRLRNRIYARVFDGKWIAAQMPNAERRRQRAAYRRGALRTMVIGLVVLGLVSGLAWKTKQAEETARLRLARSYNAKAMGLAEEGDASGALPWLVASLRLDQGHPREEKTDRLRTAMTLQQVPRVTRALLLGRPVLAMDMSPDDRLVVTGSEDGTARVWELATGLEVGSPRRHRGSVTAVQFSPDGRRVVTASADKTARVWEVGSGRPLTPPLVHPGVLTAAVFSPKGERIATISADRPGRQRVYVWDAATGRLLIPPLEAGKLVNSVAFSPNGTRLLTAAGRYDIEGSARVWDAHTGRPVGPPLDTQVSCAAFSPDGRLVATASHFYLATSAQVWEAATGRPRTGKLMHAGLMTSCAFSPDSKRLVTSSEDTTARIWDARTGAALTPPLPHASVVTQAFFSQDGHQVVTVSGGVARVWDAETGGPLTPPLRHEGVVQARLTRDGRWLATGGRDGTVRVWDLTIGLAPLRLTTGFATHATFSPDGRWLLTSELGSARVWDASSGNPISPWVPSTSWAAAFSPDGRFVVTASADRTARVWDARTGKVVHRLEHPRAVDSVFFGPVFSPNGRWVLTSCEDGQARLWDARTGRAAPPVWGPEPAVRAARFSGDGRLLATVASGGRVAIWEVASGRRLRAFAHPGEVQDAVLSRDGRRLVTVYKRQGVGSLLQIWEVGSGRPIGEPIACVGGWRLVFSPNGRRVVIQDPYAPSVRVWDTTTGLPVSPSLRHGNAIETAAFSPDGQYLVTTSWDHTARVWDAATGDAVMPPLEHGDPQRECKVSGAEFSADGRRLVTASGDGYVRIWDLPKETRPLSHLELLAEVLGAYRVDPARGDVDLQPAEFWRRWEALRASSPGDLTASKRQVTAWLWRKLERYEEAKQWPLAAACLEQLQREQPASRELYARWPNAHAESGQWNRAIADLRRSIELSGPGEAWAQWCFLARIQAGAGDLEGYRKSCAHLLDGLPHYEPDTFCFVAETCTLVPEAAPDLSPLVQLSRKPDVIPPKAPDGWYHLARVLYRSRQYSEAAKLLDKAWQLRDSGDLDASELALWVSMAQARLGHLSEARVWRQRAGRADRAGVDAATRALRRRLWREADSLLQDGGRR